MPQDTLLINGQTLTATAALAVGRGDLAVRAEPEAMRQVGLCRDRILERMAQNEMIYGFNMGFGQHQNIPVDGEKLAQLQLNLIRSHAIAFGPAATREVARMAMLLRANALVKGHSGVRPEVVAALLAMLNNELVYPFIPVIGSLGASGDLAPLSHMALNLIGEGECFFRGDAGWTRLPAAEALSRSGLEPLRLQAKEGLALNNGMQFSCAHLIYLLDRLEKFVTVSTALSACLTEIMLGTESPFIDEIQAVRPYAGQRRVAAILWQAFQESGIRASHLLPQYDPNTQDPYSTRCLPQVYGPLYDALEEAQAKLTVEINSATDNPLVFAGRVVSGGNFHGMPLALIAANVFNSFCAVVKISEARVRRVVDKEKNRLEISCLIDPGADHQVSSGLMILEYTYHALCNLILSQNNPAFLFSAVSAAAQEDHVSHAPTVILNLERALDWFAQMLACEVFMVCQGYHVLQQVETEWQRRGKIPARARLTPGKMGRAVQEAAAQLFTPVTRDRYYQPDINRIREHLIDTMRLHGVVTGLLTR
jgi:histidine ammonia-lyase